MVFIVVKGLPRIHIKHDTLTKIPKDCLCLYFFTFSVYTLGKSIILLYIFIIRLIQ